MRMWQVPFRRRRSAKPRARTVKHPVRNEFHTVVTRGERKRHIQADKQYLQLLLARR